MTGKAPNQIITGPVARALDWWSRLRSRSPFLGDGSDGLAVLDGHREVAWARRDGNTYQMTRDCQVTSLNVQPQVTLITNGYRILSRGTVRGTVL